MVECLPDLALPKSAGGGWPVCHYQYRPLASVLLPIQASYHYYHCVLSPLVIVDFHSLIVWYQCSVVLPTGLIPLLQLLTSPVSLLVNDPEVVNAAEASNGHLHARSMKHRENTFEILDLSLPTLNRRRPRNVSKVG